ncbi:MAG: TAXI family TRAP transporter solute-binding subunit [Desulfarculus sp.]|jgi:TRAP transporter TAXI family solute receptor|nr:MAG: TAXI family TRAP transporter solute-binding subunit [Desulfarculus sp.]
MKGKKLAKWALLSMTALLVLGLSLAPSTAAENPKFIKIAASSMGGTWFPLCAATAEVLNRNIKGTTFTATLGGGISNLKNIESGKLVMGIGTGSSSFQASKGLAPFSKPATKLRLIGIYYAYPYNLVVRADSGIKAVAGLKSKSLGVGKKGWSTEEACRNILATAGLDYQKIKAAGGNVTYAGFAQMNGMFKDKKLDMIVDPNNPPSPGIIEITTVTPIRLIALGPQAIAKLMKVNPGYTTVDIPGGIYKGQDKPVVNLADPAGMIVSKDLSEDLVYAMTKAIFENSGEIAKVHSVLKDFSLKHALKGAYLPLHPGAYRYYKEKGVAVPKNLMP